MISTIYHTFFYDPIYNGLIFLVSIVPGADVGIAVILLTIIVRLLLFPLSLKAIRTQIMMRELEPELTKLKEQYKGDREAQARKTMEMYRERKINPFSSFLFMFVQFLFIIALYFVFYHGNLPNIRSELLYSFIDPPLIVSTMFLGLFDVMKRNIALAALAGIFQFLQTRLSLPPTKVPSGKPSFKDDLMKSMNVQMRYGLPVIVFFASYFTSGVIALYFLVSSIVSIGQELYVRRTLKRSSPSTR